MARKKPRTDANGILVRVRMAEYPNNRDRGFAYRYIRTMTKSTAAQHMGTAGFAICCVVAMQEDVVKYSRPVAFWNRSLADIIGAAKTDTMAKARDKAVAAGWLHYENRGPRTAGIYWVTVPPEAKDIVERDWGCDEGVSIDPQNGTKGGSMLEQPTQKTGAFVGQSWVNDGVDDGSLHSASSSASSSTKNPPLSPRGENPGEAKPKKCSRREPATVEHYVEAEPSLDSPRLRAAIADWLKARRENGKTIFVGQTVTKQAKQLVGFGSQAVAAIEHSIAGGYQGLFMPRGSPSRASAGVDVDALDLGGGR